MLKEANYVEPMPTEWDFERVNLCDMDVSAHGVSDALGLLGWTEFREDEPMPTLYVHPTGWLYACRIAAQLRGAVVPAVTTAFDNIDTWLVAWKGRRVGSPGA